MKYKSRTLATIDLGTNSLLMLVAHRGSDGIIKVLEDQNEVVRLGQGLESTGEISRHAMDRTLAALSHMKSSAEKHNCESIVLCATAALREASNQDVVIEQIQNQTGLEVEVIAKNEEVRLTYLSVLADLSHDKPSMVVDIGGGSTEIGWGLGPRFDGGRSMSFGTVKLLEKQMQNNDLDAARSHIDMHLQRIPPLPPLEHYYGTAGSFTQLAALIHEIGTYSPQHVDMKAIEKHALSQWINRLSSMSLEDIKQLPGVSEKRADVLLSGALIVERLLEKFGISSFLVRDRGIRFGKMFDQFKSFESPIEFPS
ncbi:MAG: hypothetical protein R3A11_06100 [Bdellovibrionota bacterium]